MPRVPLDLTPYQNSTDHNTNTLVKEIIEGRIERNQIAAGCADQWDRADQLSAQLALAAPLITAALELDSADAWNDDPEETGPRSQDGLRLAREVFTAAVQNYIVALTAIAADHE